MSGDWQTASRMAMYAIGYDDALDGFVRPPKNATANGVLRYWQGVDDARRSGHLGELMMRPRKETNDGR